MKALDVGSAPTYSLVGDVYAILLDGSDTGGAFSLVHAIVPPGGGPPFHTHSREDETFYILEGEITVFRDGREFVGGPGTAVHLERGVEHRFQNCSDKPARMLIHVAPSGFERMVQEAGVRVEPGTTSPAPVGEDDVPRLLAASERAGITIRM
jgi:quercetin dioxygenase-like cupin family protein